MAVFASTERLNFRGYHDSDCEKVAALLDNREMNRTGPGAVVPRGSAMQKEAAELAKTHLMFVIIEVKHDDSTGEDSDEDRWAGIMMLGNSGPSKNRQTDFGIGIVAKWQNKGVGTEATRWLVDYAFAQLGVHRIILGLFASNERALAVYKKCGFVQEGRRRKAVWQDGDWHDFLSMAILEEDWKEAKRTVS